MNLTRSQFLQSLLVTPFAAKSLALSPTSPSEPITIRWDWDSVKSDLIHRDDMSRSWPLWLKPSGSISTNHCLLLLHNADCTGRVFPCIDLCLGFKRARVSVWSAGWQIGPEREVTNVTLRWHSRPATPEEFRTGYCKLIALPKITTTWEEHLS